MCTSNKIFASFAPLRLCVKILLITPLTLTAQEARFINAASVPEISITADGQLWYPRFPQGRYTGAFTTDNAAVTYKIKDLRGGKERALTVSLPKNSRQAFIIHGDFSPSADEKTRRRAALPNIKIFPLDLAADTHLAPLRYRIINLVPNQPLLLLTKPEPVEIPCEQTLTLSAQKNIATLTVQAGAQIIPVLIRQQRILRDCDIIFYETGTGVSFIRYFAPSIISEVEED